MKIRRYYGSTIREAIQKVRAEQGPDAVILSNRKVDDGVEIIAAVDFDEILLDADRAADAPAAPPRNRSGAVPIAAVQGARSATHSAAPVAPLPTAAAPIPLTVPAAPPPRATARSAAARPGDADGRGQKIAAIRQPLSAAQPAARPPAAAPRAEVAADPELARLRHELTSLRGLVEEQIAGLVWGDLARRNPVNAALLRQLSQLDLSPLLSREIVSELEGRRCTDAAHAWRHALVALARRVPTEEDTILGSGGIVALLGPTGAGKTTTIAKLAAHYCVRHGARRVALVTTDDYRIGAHDHLRTYARLLGVPLRVTSDAAGLAQAVADFSDRALVLVDSAGISQRDRRVSAQCTLIRSASDAVRCYLVLPATTRERSLEEIIHAYREVSPRGCIVTKLDECGDLGGVLSVLARNRLPVAYTSDGQRVPEDLDVACAYRLVSRAVALMRSAGPAAGVEAIARAAHA